MEYKRCHLCGERKRLDDFYRASGMRDGHRNGCNHGIGKLKDDPDLLLRAVVYLREGGFLELLAG
jgi:hypothetical protein